MGQQQLLLIILGVIVVGIAIAVGITMFGANSVGSNKDAITASLINVCADAYQYKIRPSSMGGGSQAYTGYTIPSKMRANDNGTYAVSSAGATSCVITGTSNINTAWVATCTADDTGKTSITYAGW
jgi:hypothetical protein